MARKAGWDKAVQKLEEISDARVHEFRLFMGNFFLHQQNFGIIGLWYPKIPVQRSLL